MNKDKVSRFFSVMAIIIAIGAFVVSICSCRLTTGGIVAGLIGVCATFMVGYQIWNTIDVKDTLKRNEQVAKEFEDLKHIVDINSRRSQENLDIMQSLVAYQGQMNFMATSEALLFMHHAVLSALDSERDDFSYILDYLSVFTSELTDMAITGSNFNILNKNNERVIQDKRSPYYGRTIEYAVSYFRSRIDQIDEQIQAHTRFYMIKSDYEKVINALHEKLKEIIEQH